MQKSVEFLRALLMRQMTAVWQDFDPGSLDAPAEFMRHPDRMPGIIFAPDDQGGAADAVNLLFNEGRVPVPLVFHVGFPGPLAKQRFKIV